MLRNSLTIPVDQVRIGMFVAELDRAWRDTPFLLQGFRVADQDDIDQLRNACGKVTIDPKHSTPGSFEHLAGLDEPERRFDPRQWLKRLKSRWSHLRQASADVARQRERDGLIPPGVVPTLYGPLAPIDAELARAENVFANADTALESVARQIADGDRVDLEALGGAVENMVESAIANPDALMWVARIRAEDAVTYTHGVKVAVYLLQMGRHLGFPPEHLANLGALGLLLDLGKIKVDRDLLLKTGRLTPEEFLQVKRHVELGIAALDESGTLSGDVRDGIAQHGRMAAIADSFAALTSRRPYAASLPAYDALKLLYQQAGAHYHAPLVEQFVQAIGVFPSGSLVELTTGEVATVLAHNRIRRLEPRVLVLTEPDKTLLHEPRPLDLLQGLLTLMEQATAKR